MGLGKIKNRLVYSVAVISSEITLHSKVYQIWHLLIELSLDLKHGLVILSIFKKKKKILYSCQ